MNQDIFDNVDIYSLYLYRAIVDISDEYSVYLFWAIVNIIDECSIMHLSKVSAVG